MAMTDKDENKSFLKIPDKFAVIAVGLILTFLFKDIPANIEEMKNSHHSMVVEFAKMVKTVDFLAQGIIDTKAELSEFKKETSIEIKNMKRDIDILKVKCDIDGGAK
jgi:hypothetical protein